MMEAKGIEITEEVEEINQEQAKDFNVNVKITVRDREIEYNGVKLVGFMLSKEEKDIKSTIISVGMSSPDLMSAAIGNIKNLQDTMVRETEIALARLLGIDPELLRK